MFARLEEPRWRGEPCTEPLRIVVVGGGPTGVEMAGTLAELRDALVGFGYPELSRSDVRVVLVEMLDRTLGAFDERLSRYAATELERRGVELRLGQTVAEVREDEVLLSSGELLKLRGDDLGRGRAPRRSWPTTSAWTRFVRAGSRSRGTCARRGVPRLSS